MGSSKSRGNPGRGALEPRRRPGKERVAALMEAAAAVIAERGFEAATMAEIASRAGALVGSLYHFFPNKEVLAEALIQRYRENIAAAFDRIEAEAATRPIEWLADALVDLLVELDGDSKAIRALLEAHAESSAIRDDFRNATLRQIVRTLRVRAPGLDLSKAEDMAVVLLQNMKTMKIFASEAGSTAGRGPAAELREMTRLYLASKLADRP